MSSNIDTAVVREILLQANEEAAQVQALEAKLAEHHNRLADLAKEATSLHPEGKFGPYVVRDEQTGETRKISAMQRTYKKTGETTFVWRGLMPSDSGSKEPEEVIEL